MGEFLETPRFPENILFGVTGGPRFSTEVVEMSGGATQKNANWTYPLMTYNIAQTIDRQELIDEAYAFFMVCQGRFVGFRFKDPNDFKTSALDAAVAASDQPLGTGDGSAQTLDLIKTYTRGARSLERRIRKPVTGTVLVAVAGVDDPRWSVDTAAGTVTAQADITASISDITQASQAQVTASSHGLSVGHSVHIDGVSGMTQINGTRSAVASVIDTNTFTIDRDTTGYSAYTSGGTFHTLAQAGEAITWGGEFDVPVQFAADQLPIRYPSPNLLTIDDLPIVEIRNP